MCKDLKWKFFNKPTYCVKWLQKKFCVSFAVYFDALLVWLWSSFHLRKFHSSIGITILGFLPNASVNYWEFSDLFGPNLNVFLPCMKLGSAQLTIPWFLFVFVLFFVFVFVFLPSLFNVCHLHAWPSTQQCPQDTPVPISSTLSPWNFLLEFFPTRTSPLRLSNFLSPSPQSNENAGHCLHVPTYALGSKIASRQKAG